MKPLSPALALSLWIVTPPATAQALEFPTRVPIHTQADDPDGGAYGVWAAGDGFKVSFAAGCIDLYPLGATPDGGTWSWRTESIEVGEQVLTESASAARTAFTADRFETRHASGVIEAYDLRASGVEQSFVFAERPAAVGPVTIVGRVESPWRATERGGTHDALSFVGDSGPVVEYGRAWAIDAVGRRLALETAWDGRHITIDVPASFVAEAVYPLLVDPLVGTTAIFNAGAANVPIAAIDVARDGDQNKIWYAMTQSVSGRDDDLRVYRCEDDFSAPVLVFADITSSWSTERPRVATVGGARKSVTVFQRVFPTSEHALRWHTHPVDDPNSSGSYGFLSNPSNEHDWLPDVGGSQPFASGDQALVVWQHDVGTTTFQNTATSTAMYALLDVGGSGQGTLAAPARLRNISYDQECPRVAPLVEGGSNSGWPVVWQEWGAVRNGGRAWDGVVRRVNMVTNGAVLSTQVLYARTTRTAPTHCLRPSIAGERGRYMLVYAESLESLVNGKTTFPQGHALVAERIDWPGNTGPTFPYPPHRRIEQGQRRYVSEACAYDSTTRSHWVATAVDTLFELPFAEKLGFRGQTVAREQAAQRAHTDPVVGGVCFDDDNGRFAFGFAVPNFYSNYWSAYGVLFTYGAANPPASFGISCATTNANSAWQGSYYRGDEFSAALLENAPPRAPAFCLISLYPRTTALSFIGMPSCFLYLDLQQMLPAAIPATVSSRGGARVPLPLFEDTRISDLFFQWLLLEPGANPLGLTASSAMRVTIVD